MADKAKSLQEPAGQSKSIKAALLEFGAGLIQDVTPTKQFDIYMAGLHCARHDPSMQMEAHHYCKQVNQDFLQCVVFDGNTEDANLIGIEYIISERLFESLPAEEKRYWHPHNYEILSGQLVAPGLPEAAEKAMLKMLMNSYGKTWHTWHTGRPGDESQPGHTLPFGDATLMWSFNRDGESDPRLKQMIQERLGIDTEEKRKRRQDLVELAHPQCGVDLLKGRFSNAEAQPPPGVKESGACRE